METDQLSLVPGDRELCRALGLCKGTCPVALLKAKVTQAAQPGTRGTSAFFSFAFKVSHCFYTLFLILLTGKLRPGGER